MPIQQPVGQVRLTNVAVVRLKKAGKRFEVAAYKNKVMNWRSKVETDINEVLQVPTVFLNVSRGVHAKREDLREAFGTEDHLQAALVILAQGELEVGEKERSSALDSLFRDIATIVSEKCLNPDTRRPYTVTIIEKALRECHFSVVSGKSAKQQSLKAIQSLQGLIPIARARMRLRVTAPEGDAREVRSLLSAHHPEYDQSATGAGAGSGAGAADGAGLDAAGSGNAGGEEGYEQGDRRVWEPIVDPGAYRLLEEAVRAKGLASVTVEVLAMAVGSGSSGGASGGAAGGKGPKGILKHSGGRKGGSDDEDEDEEDDDNAGRGTGGAAGAEACRIAGQMSAMRLGGAGSAADQASASGGAGGSGPAQPVRRVVAQPGRRLACNSCGATFEDADAHRAHHRGDWHRFNLKRKVKAMGPVTEEEYAAIPEKERTAFLDADV